MGLILAGPSAAFPIDSPDCPEFQKLCIEADRSGGVDMKTGTANLEGNVRGVLKEHDVRFRSEILRAYRDEKNAWTRLELDQAVEIEQTERHAQGDHAVILNDTGEATLIGNARLSEPQTYAEGERLYLERSPRRSTLTALPGERVFMRREARVLAEEAPPGEAPSGPSTPPASADPRDPFVTREPEIPAESGPRSETVFVAPAPEYLPDTLEIWSDQSVLERDSRLARFTGRVEMHRVELGWNVWGDKVDLEFSEDRRLIRFDAEGSVRIEQPGRVMLADQAHSQNELETILLVGNAKVIRTGEFDLASDRMEVFTNVERGLVQSEEQQRPIRLTIDLAKAPPYQLTDAGLDRLRVRGLPDSTMSKLETLRERPYADRNAFIEALRTSLTAREADLYQDVIAEAARGTLP